MPGFAIDLLTCSLMHEGLAECGFVGYPSGHRGNIVYLSQTIRLLTRTLQEQNLFELVWLI